MDPLPEYYSNPSHEVRTRKDTVHGAKVYASEVTKRYTTDNKTRVSITLKSDEDQTEHNKRVSNVVKILNRGIKSSYYTILSRRELLDILFLTEGLPDSATVSVHFESDHNPELKSAGGRYQLEKIAAKGNKSTIVY